MLAPDDLLIILDRIVNRQHTDADLEVLRQALTVNSSQNVVQIGKYAVNIGQGQDIRIGDQTIYQGTDAETIRGVFRSVLQEMQISGQPPASNLRQSKPKKFQLTPKRAGIVSLVLVTVLSTFVVLSPQFRQRLRIAPTSCSDSIAPKKNLIVIAKFKSNDNKLDEVIPFFQDKLLDGFRNIEKPDVVICSIDRSVSNENEARSLGKKLRAAIVIWGLQSRQALEVNVTTLKIQVGYLYYLRIPMTDAQDFEKIKDLPQVVYVMTAFALSEIYNRQEKPQLEEARKTLRNAIVLTRLTNPDLKSNKYVAQKLGLSYFFLGQLYSPLDGDCLKAREDCIEAATAFNQAATLNQEITQAFIEEGILQERLGNSSEAIRAYTQLIQINPESKEGLKARAYRGNIYLIQVNTEKAIEDFKFICQREPNNYKWLSYLGISQLQAGDIEEARNTYRQVKRVLGQDKTAKNEVINDLNSLAQNQPNLLLKISLIISLLE
jgi:Flp pilus assembly protein TadD